MSGSQPHPSQPSTSDPALYEQTHVHDVYSQIAPHFSATRHKPWPQVSRFLLSRAPGSVGLDVGCGNGKYLSVNPDVYLVGSDRSAELVSLAAAAIRPPEDGCSGTQRRRRSRMGPEAAAVADGLAALPFRPACADFVISVAVVHHFSTRERRVRAIAALLECVRPARRRTGGEDGVEGGGRVLVCVWALEQASSRRGWDEGADQDQLVPWVMKGPRRKGKQAGGRRASERQAVEAEEEGDGGEEQEEEEQRTFQRYYHLYRKGELEEDVRAAGGVVLESGYERDNWWVVAVSLAG